MQEIIKIIRAHTEAPFGFCPFVEIGEHLIECRAKARIPVGSKTVICFAFPYKIEGNPPKNISRYAAVPDYHVVCGKILEKITAALRERNKDNKFEYFIDNSPIPEVYAASRAGLGRIGKNGLLITERFGSFVFLGEIVTDLEIKSDTNVTTCADCGACKSACPVGLKKSECLSAITQQKGELSAEQKKLIKAHGSVWGCDICQNVCPHNKKAENSFIEEFCEGYRSEYQRGEDIAQRAYEWRGEKVILRNALLFDEVVQVVSADATATKGEIEKNRSR